MRSGSARIRFTRWQAVMLLVLWIFGGVVGASPALEGTWQGRIELPNQHLDIEVVLQGENNQLSGTISIPAQNAKNLPLKELLVSTSNDLTSVAFVIEGVPGNPSFLGELALSEDGEQVSSLSGLFSQSGGTFAFNLTPADPIGSALEALGDLVTTAEQALLDFQAPGAAMGIVYKGELIYARGFGLRDVKNNLPMTADTLFAIGSTTKAMTATVLGMLVEAGMLSWDDPVRDYLPQFNLADEAVASQTTVRDLVTHRTGMPRHDLMWYNNTSTSREEGIRRLEYLPLTAEPRSRFQYNNLMFMTAGVLAATVANQPSWEDLMRTRLLDPLNMHRSNFSVTQSQQDENFALPYLIDEGVVSEIAFRPLDFIGPAGSVNSSINEMANWLKLNLTQGQFEGNQLVSTTTLDELRGYHMPMGSEPSSQEFSPPVYALGWMVGTYQGKKIVHHSGGIDGFITNVMLFPQQDLGVVAFANANTELPQWLSFTAVDRLLGHPQKDWLGQALARKKSAEAVNSSERDDPRRKRKTKPSHKINAYVGEYAHQGYGPLRIELDGNQLQLVYNDMNVPLSHWHYDVWKSSAKAPDFVMRNHLAQFHHNLNGDIAQISIRAEPTAEPIVFDKQVDAQMKDPTWLAQWVGDYATPVAVLSVVQKGPVLYVVVPGQPTYELVPELGGRFHFDSVPDVVVQFDAGTKNMLVMQPATTIEAKKL
jgi:CubicO group peptidase (beta-lactamase class C family)